MNERLDSSTGSGLYALLIGVDFYTPTQKFPDGSYYDRLGGCVNDIKRVETFLTDWLGTPADHILKLTASVGPDEHPPEPKQDRPTYENIVGKFKALTELAPKGAQVYIHYSGHGGRARTAYPELKGEDGLDEGLVPTNIDDPNARYVRDVELAYLLQAMVDKGLVVTLVLDSCHSGGATRGKGKAKRRSMVRAPGSRGFDTTPRPTHSDVASSKELARVWTQATGGRTRGVKPGSGWLTRPRGYTMLAACRANEYAYEDTFEGGVTSGALTYWLLDSFQSMSAGTSYKVLHDRVLAKVRSWMPVQTPLLQGEGDRAVFGSDRLAVCHAIPVISVDEATGTVTLNGGEVHGLRRGSLLALYAPGTTDCTAVEARLALVEVVRVKEADCWAEIKERYSDEPIEQGALAALLGQTDLSLQRAVTLVVDDPCKQAALQAAIEAHGAGFVHLAGGDETVHMQVTLNECREYEIWDGTGALIPNVRPAIKATEAGAVERVVKRLVHLAKYQHVKALDNPSSVMAQKLRVELIGAATGDESGNAPIYRPGESVTLRITNLLEPNLFDANDATRILNVTLLDLQPDWGITQLLPAEGGAAQLVQPGKSLEISFNTYLPPGYTESTDILKVFATQSTTQFKWLELPVLDKPPVHRGARGQITDPLERLMAAFTGAQAPSDQEIKARAIEMVSVSSQDRPWAVAQVELCVKA